jgi:hypothetical protein
MARMSGGRDEWREDRDEVGWGRVRWDDDTRLINRVVEYLRVGGRMRRVVCYISMQVDVA